jgi:hypothetical protein
LQENSKRIIIRDLAEVAGFFDVFTSYDIPTENEISKMLDEGYELEMYIIEGRIHVECYPRDL